MSTANGVSDSEQVAEENEQPKFIGAFFAAICLFGLGAWVFYDLWRLENGVVESIRVWDLIAMLYETLGFWPAVLLLPAFGLFATYQGIVMLTSYMGITSNSETTPNSMSCPQNAGPHGSTEAGCDREEA